VLPSKGMIGTWVCMLHVWTSARVTVLLQLCYAGEAGSFC
jgi:hypothetical protein